MRKTGLLRARLLAVVAELGHTDTLVIADVGLPLPPGVERIDLALVPSVPGMLQTLRAVLAELAVESAVVADEMARRSPALHAVDAPGAGASTGAEHAAQRAAAAHRQRARRGPHR